MPTVTGQATDPASPGVAGSPMNIDVPGTFAVGVFGDGGKGFPSPSAAVPVGRIAIGVRGICADSNGVGVQGENSAGGNAGSFFGNVIVTGNHTVSKNCSISGDISGNGNLNLGKNLTVKGDSSITGTLNVVADIVLAGAASDCAEDFDVATGCEIEPGTVMVLDDTGALRPSDHGYDRRVAGVISGAGEYRPGMILGRCESPQQRVPIALIGKVFCKADAQFGAIQVGDLLTTSPTVGHAMKACDPSKAFGAVIGKALRGLREGCGLIPVLVAPR